MNYTVFKGTRSVGELSIESCGLYYEITGKIQNEDAVQRMYGICGNDGYYIGIPNRKGELFRRVSKRNFTVPQRVILSDLPPEQWKATVEIGDQPQTALQEDTKEREQVVAPPMILVDCEDAEQLPLIQKENGGEENEVHTQNYGDDVDPLLLADLPADYDYGGTCTEEADCDHF